MIAEMDNFYKLLGLNTSATNEEIRRAYRVLARRYHPDVNPGKTSEDKFKKIAEAYRILNDTERRQAYDIELQNHLRVHGGDQPADPRINAYRRQQAGERTSARQRFYEAKHNEFGQTKPTGSASGNKETKAKPEDAPQPPPQRPARPEIERLTNFGRRAWDRFFGGPREPQSARPSASARPEPDRARRRDSAHDIAKISLIEVSVTMRDVVHGVKKTVEIAEPEGTRKVSVRIPPGVRNGSVVHLRSKGEGRSGSDGGEDLVIIVRVAAHPFLSMHARGLVIEVPISVHEALAGASVTLPSLDEPVTVKIPPGSQSGAEIRLKGRGVLTKEGDRGDMFYRLMVHVPGAVHAVGIAERAAELEKYYESPVRQALPKTLLEV
jgi:DnaJ-class molecular chaperone